MKKHKHIYTKICSCNLIGLEPDDYCPVYGGYNIQPKCDKCGQFMKRKGSANVKTKAS